MKIVIATGTGGKLGDRIPSAGIPPPVPHRFMVVTPMPRRILVVEDDQPILELMDLMIRRLGFEPVLVTNGLEALESVQKEIPALIILDIMMMPINGWEFLERLRGQPGYTEIPVIIFSASPSLEERMEQLHDRNLGVLHKPVTYGELRDGINRFLA